MAQFKKRVNVWGLSKRERRELQIGQHISAGGAHGRWCGQINYPNSVDPVDVAAWYGGAAQRGGMTKYMRDLIEYARTKNESFAK